MRYFALFSLVGVFVCMGWTQKMDNAIFLNNSTIYPANLNNTPSKNTADWPVNNCNSSGCFAIIQLTDIPTDDQRNILLELGIQLYDYIPNRAYLASLNSSESIDLPDFVVVVLPFQAVFKQQNVPISLTTGIDGQMDYHLTAIPFPDVSTILLAEALTEAGATITYFDEKSINYRISVNLLPEILACPLLKYTEAVPSIPFSEGEIGRSNLHLTGVNQGPGKGYDGSGIAIGIADDGRVNHLDFYGRLIDHTQYDTGSHGEMVLGMAAGDGNINPLAAGAASGAEIHLFDIGNYEHITNAVSNFNQYGIVITSTSYGDGCGGNYTLATRDIDEQVYQNQHLLHCFSAGNRGEDPCFNAYSWLGTNEDGAYYSTQTGGRKAGKNILSIGNNEWNDQVVSSSSRGPTLDGRIKPDLCALGQADYTTGVQNTYRQSSGTSAASPNVAGALVCLYQFFKETNNDQYPSSALMKAMALNTADDQGPAGPDFTYGWGRMNAANALKSLEQHQYFEGQINHGQQQSFQLAVPSGTRRLKVMLYWHDPAGNTLSSRMLVNDLDLSLQTPSSSVLLPWIPNSTPHLDSLALPARPGLDRLNNAEQIVIESPASGYYNVLIDGFQIPQNGQSYVVVYQIETASIQISYPQGGSCFVPQEQTLISWDAVGNQGAFSIDYSIDAGQSWLSLADDIPGDRRSYIWTIPSLTNAVCKVRVGRGNEVSISEGLSVISPLPVFDVTYSDFTQAEISWHAIEGATAYAVYLLGEKHMEQVATTSEPSYLLTVETGQKYWVSVAPILGDKTARRANAQLYEHYACDRYVNLEIQFDQYPGETSWYILDSSGSIIEYYGPYTEQTPNSFISLSICLPPGCFTLVMTDSYNDGLCCENGNGYYRLSDENGTVLLQGGDFEGYTYDLFCPEATALDSLFIATEIIQQISCFGQQDAIAKVIANGGSGNYTYQWSNGASSSGIQNIAAGLYQVTVTDGEQTLVQSIQITEPSPINIQYTTQAAVCNDGVINLFITGGTPPYTYNWSDSNADAFRQNLPSGSYFVLVSDANGCTQTATVLVDGAENLQLQLEGINPNCPNSNDGSITAMITGGQASYQLQWSNGQQGITTLTGLASGTYSLLVRSGSCLVEQTLTLTPPAGFSILANQLPPSCNGALDASIDISVSGGLAPYEYQWSNGQQAAFMDNLSSGVYLLTLTDANGCNETRGYDLAAPPLLQVQAMTTSPQPETGGSVLLNINGGTPPYIAQWSNGEQGISLENLTPGTYSVLITDAQMCTVSTSITIIEPVNVADPLYCSMRGASTTYEWIDAITVNGNNYYTGNDSGYGDYLDISIPLVKNLPQLIELFPAYTSTLYNEYWVIWIDYNQDGDFDDLNETVLSDGPVVGLHTVTFDIPTTALSGRTRMRIAMQYSEAAQGCVNITYGEVEDYTVNIMVTENLMGGLNAIQPSLSAENMQWKAYPNPVVNTVLLEGRIAEKSPVLIRVFNSNGQLITIEKTENNTAFFQHSINMKDYPEGFYFVEISGEGWTEILKIVKGFW